jgi:glycosyltransferase involved in cell wall biosynthesis
LNKRRTIAIIVPGGIGTGANNVGVPALEQMVTLLAQDSAVTVFSLFAVNNTYTPKGFELISIPSRNFVVKSIRLFFLFMAHHNEKRFDAIHGFWTLPSGILAVILSMIFKTKSLVTVMGGDGVALPEIGYGLLRNWLHRKLILGTLSRADEVMVVSGCLRHNFSLYGLSRKMHIVPMGIDTKQFVFEEKKTSDPVQFLHIGNLIPVKDQRTLLNAFKIISDQISAHLTIVGTGPLEAKLRSLAVSLNLVGKIDWLSPMPNHKLVDLYNQSDVMLHTSLFEGQPVVACEAMSAGVLVCGTAIGVLYDMPDCCVAVPVKDHRALAQEVLKVLQDAERSRAIRMKARHWIVNHDVVAAVNKLKKLYDQ